MPAPSSRRSAPSRYSRCSNRSPPPLRRWRPAAASSLSWRRPTPSSIRIPPSCGASLQNLLSNALRYGQVEGRPARVLLGRRRIGEELRIEVRGQRAGHRSRQADDHLRRVRAPASRGRRATRGAGLGLGLAIVDRIARMLEAAGTHFLGISTRLDLLGAGAEGRGCRGLAIHRAGAAAPPACRGRECACIDNEARGARGDGGTARRLGGLISAILPQTAVLYTEEGAENAMDLMALGGGACMSKMASTSHCGKVFRPLEQRRYVCATTQAHECRILAVQAIRMAPKAHALYASSPPVNRK